MRARRAALVLAALVATWTPAVAQDRAQTLADIRQELSVLNAEIQGLKRELQPSGSQGVMFGGGSALERINVIEAALAEVTAKAEELENRVNRVVSDGTNRIGDLEFRLVELEGGDVSRLGETSTLGGGNLPQVAAVAPSAPSTGPELAVGEQADFDKAMSAYDAGSYETAVIQFATFAETYLGGPLTAEAHYWRGKSLAALGNTGGAARAYLESFSGDPDGDLAPQALLDLGLALDSLGQGPEACTMLGEVTARFPSSEASIQAQTARASMNCL